MASIQNLKDNSFSARPSPRGQSAAELLLFLHMSELHAEAAFSRSIVKGLFSSTGTTFG